MLLALNEKGGLNYCRFHLWHQWHLLTIFRNCHLFVMNDGIIKPALCGEEPWSCDSFHFPLQLRILMTKTNITNITMVIMKQTRMKLAPCRQHIVVMYIFVSHWNQHQIEICFVYSSCKLSALSYLVGTYDTHGLTVFGSYVLDPTHLTHFWHCTTVLPIQTYMFCCWLHQ